MVARDFESVVRELLIMLANEEFEAIVASCSASRLSADDLREVIRDYGRTFIEPPSDAFQRLDTVEVRNAAMPTWSVWVPLWSREEGQSDLELHLTIRQESDHLAVELDDLHVP